MIDIAQRFAYACIVYTLRTVQLRLTPSHPTLAPIDSDRNPTCLGGQSC
jgi:hypothetical protein